MSLARGCVVGVVMHKLERSALTRLLDTCGAEITLSLPAHIPLARSHRAKLRYSCDPGVAQWPGDSVLAQAKTTILTPAEFPTNQRSMLRSTMAQAGLEVRDDVCWISMAATRHQIADALVAADSPTMLLVGAEAVAYWRADVLMKQIVGGMYPAKMSATGLGRLTGVVESPGAVLRGSIDPRQWRARVARFVDCVVDRITEDADKLTWRCVDWNKERERCCGDAVDAWDLLGLPWCRRHVEKGWNAGMLNATRGRKLANVEMQEVLL